LTTLGFDQNHPNVGRNLATPLGDKTHCPLTNLFFFWQRIVKRPHSFKFLLFLKKNSSNFALRGGMCHHNFNSFKTKKNITPPPTSFLFFGERSTLAQISGKIPPFSQQEFIKICPWGGVGERGR